MGRNHAVVLGGSIAGLFAARVLADEYATVTIVERDRLTSRVEHRRGVPHGHHVHGLLPRGRQLMEELLPGLTEQLVAEGALPGDILKNVRWYLNGQLLRQVPTGLAAISASRPLLEGAIRNRVTDRYNVSVLDGYDIVGLCSSEDRRRITGARITSLYGEGSRVLPADLVVDATGRGSRTPRWLSELGYEPPSLDRVTIDLAYSTRLFKLSPGALGDNVVVATARFGGHERSAVMQRLEGDRVLVTLVGVLGERPPLDLAGFIEYARSLPVPDTYEFVRDAEPIGDAMPFRCPTYVRHRYEQLLDFPAGLVVVGDAVCSFNPVYGQGMSVAAMNAAGLRDELRHGGDPEPGRYFTSVARTLDAPWGIATGTDLAVPGVTGPALPESPLTPGYMAALQLAAVEDAELATAFIRVTSLVDPPPALLRPEITERVTAAAHATAR